MEKLAKENYLKKKLIKILKNEKAFRDLGYRIL